MTNLKNLIDTIESLEKRGEMVIILEGIKHTEEAEMDMIEVEEKIRKLLSDGLSTKDVAKDISEQYKINKNDAYSLTLGIE